MFYDAHCQTENQKTVFKAVLELCKDSSYVAIQELNHLGIPRKELGEILAYFEKFGLFKEVQHLGENYPVIFRV